MNSSDVVKHNSSDLLNIDENKQIFNMIGENCQVLSMTVVELHRSPDSSGEGDWTKEDVGVLCLVLDQNLKCHFFRIFCLFRKRMVWEYEIHDFIQYSAPKPALHVFKAEEHMYAFYFVSEQEASSMNENLRKIFYDEQESERSEIHEINPVVEAPSAFATKPSDSTSKRSSIYDELECKVFNLCIDKGGENRKKKITKDDISYPQNFRHISHIGSFKEKMNQIKTTHSSNDNDLKNENSQSPTTPSTHFRSLHTANDSNASLQYSNLSELEVAPPLPEKKHRLRIAHLGDMPSPNLPEKRLSRPDRRLSTLKYTNSHKIEEDMEFAPVCRAVELEKRSSDLDRDSCISQSTNNNTIKNNIITPALVPVRPFEKSPHLSNRIPTVQPLSEDSVVYETITPVTLPRVQKTSLKSDPRVSTLKNVCHDSRMNGKLVANVEPILQEKKPPRFGRQVLPFNSSPLTSKMSNEKIHYSRSSAVHPIGSPPSPPTLPQIIAANLKPSSVLEALNDSDSDEGKVTSSKYDTVAYPPRPITKSAVSSRRQSSLDTNVKNNSERSCVYDVVSSPPRPVSKHFKQPSSADSPPVLDSPVYTEVYNTLKDLELEAENHDLVSSVHKKSSNTPGGNNTSQIDQKVLPKPYAVHPVKSIHPFLLPPSCSSSNLEKAQSCEKSSCSSTSSALNPLTSKHDALRAALISSINKRRIHYT